MQVISIGIDIVEIYRIRGMYDRFPDRFVNRVYTPDERKRLKILKDPVNYLAGRWAVKEAVLKVLGTGLSGGISWQDLNIKRLKSGAPSVELGGKARERARAIGVETVLVSISHGKEYAVAQALGLGHP